MGTPDRPNQVDQLDGSWLAGFNCTCAAGAMALDRQTIGRLRTSGATVRRLTGDSTGGTTLRQVEFALRKGWGVNLDVQLGIRFGEMEKRIHAGQGAIIQGRESVFRSHPRLRSSETFGGNHAGFCNSGEGWHQDKDGDWHADSFLFYNPLADARRKGIAKSPYLVPRDLLVEWCGKLDVSTNPNSYDPLGEGRVFAAFTRDTEPHFHSKHGGRATTPFPDEQIVHRPSGARRPVKVRSAPDVNANVVETIEPGDLFVAYQFVSNGSPVRGSRKWFGSHGGARWIHSSKVRKEGGDK